MLPARRIEKPKRLITDMEIGEKGYIHVWGMKVAASLACYLDPKTPLLDENNEFMTLQVDRKADGFHVRLLDRQWTWKPDTVDSELPKLIPVASISES